MTKKKLKIASMRLLIALMLLVIKTAEAVRNLVQEAKDAAAGKPSKR